MYNLTFDWVLCLGFNIPFILYSRMFAVYTLISLVIIISLFSLAKYIVQFCSIFKGTMMACARVLTILAFFQYI